MQWRRKPDKVGFETALCRRVRSRQQKLCRLPLNIRVDMAWLTQLLITVEKHADHNKEASSQHLTIGVEQLEDLLERSEIRIAENARHSRLARSWHF